MSGQHVLWVFPYSRYGVNFDRVELGRAYHKLGRRQEAWRELEAAVHLDVEDINAHLQKVDAEELLRDLRWDAARHRWKAGTPLSDQVGLYQGSRV